MSEVSDMWRVFVGPLYNYQNSIQLHLWFQLLDSHIMILKNSSYEMCPWKCFILVMLICYLFDRFKMKVSLTTISYSFFHIYKILLFRGRKVFQYVVMGLYTPLVRLESSCLAPSMPFWVEWATERLVFCLFGTFLDPHLAAGWWAQQWLLS